MKKYLLILEDELMKKFKVESAKAGTTIKQFIIEAVEEKIEKENAETEA